MKRILMLILEDLDEKTTESARTASITQYPCVATSDIQRFLVSLLNDLTAGGTGGTATKWRSLVPYFGLSMLWNISPDGSFPQCTVRNSPTQNIGTGGGSDGGWSVSGNLSRAPQLSTVDP